MTNKPKRNDYDQLFKVVVIATVVALAVLLILLLAFFATGALQGKQPDDGIVIITGDDSSTTDTETPAVETTAATAAPETEPGPETEADTEPDTESEPAIAEPMETEPVDIKEDPSDIPRYMGLDGIEKEFPGTVLAETEDLGDEYLRRIVFLGDSLTYGLKVYGMLDGGRDTKQVWVPSNGTLLLSNVADAKILFPDTGTEITVREAVGIKKPDILVIALGINGISFLGENDFTTQFAKLIGEVKKQSPDTTVILQSMFPVAASYELQKSINNNKICRGNYWMAKAANENGAYFLNTAEVLVGPDGYLPEDMQSGDGLHLSISAYKKVLEYIKTHGVPQE